MPLQVPQLDATQEGHIDKAFLNETISDIMTNCLKMKETKRSSSGLVLQ
jgi:hypothetical protein